MNIKKTHFISIIIIGHNTKKNLVALLTSINKQIWPHQEPIEVIYVDDGSDDSSVQCFEQFVLKFKKKCIKLEKNQGRVAATQAGINVATGSWFCFVRSNIVLTPGVLFEFTCSITTHNRAVAFMGSIKYKSSDLFFQNYLNDFKRGINRYRHHEKIHFRHLLFGNCIIHSDVFKHLALNESLKYYGGEELDLAEQIFSIYHKQIRSCKKAKAIRVGHPGFLDHALRLIEFGQYNVRSLSIENQKLVLGFAFYLRNLKKISFLWRVLFLLSARLYKIRLFRFQYLIIKIGLLSSIMGGLLKSMPAQNSQIQGLLVLLLPILLF